jgi:ABC-type multidrug transport system fused ATPase/permease subunit
MALYRLATPSEGCVRVDGIDVAALNLAELRRRIAIIPQEPVMFAGTIRSNLDPFGEHDDAALARALERASLPQLARDLGAKVEAFGGNLSLGVQQLVCLARAMLNPSRVLLLDEATAALDLASDAMVQRVLRTEFADRTVVTIAHRLDTIIDSDRVLIMDQGKVAEFAPPHELLASPDSIFSQLCRQTGGQYEQLRATAQRHHETMLALQARLAAADDLAAREAAAQAAAQAPPAGAPAVVVKVSVV